MMITKLENSMTIAIKNTFAETVRCSLFIKGGYCYEDASCQGITHLLEHMLVRNYSDDGKALYKELREIGVDVEAETNTEFVVFSIQASKTHLKKCLNLLRRIFDKTIWSERDLVREKAVVYRQIENKYFSAVDEYFYNNFLPDELCGSIMGSKNSVEKITLQELYAWRDDVITAPNACLVIVGGTDSDTEQFVKDTFSTVVCKESSLTGNNAVPTDFCNRDKYNIHFLNGEKDSVTIKIIIDVQRENSFEAMIIANGLGIGNGCEFSLKLREELGFTDETCFGNLWMYENFSLIDLEVTVDLQNALIAMKSINGIVEKAVTFDEKQWQAHKTYLVEKLKAYYEGSLYEESLAFGWNNFILNQNVNSVSDIISKLESCNDVSLTAKKVLQPENVSILVSSASKTLKKEIGKSLL